ncbi:HAMP domain-containing sensor histidine kinase [Lapillicoccus sp.]|uniref:sensor histidine kinase n=1 Tax=Lapillicoccus sp. TaxID=1909287 RepID=UPI0025D21737|nr:HAMP domain-containing sensor histidine kinase [Lapillicoccus sp.]
MKVRELPRSRLPSGVRAHATIAAAGIVGIVFLLGGAALVLLLQNSLTSTQMDTVRIVVEEDATVLANDGVSALAQNETDHGPDGVLVQVVSAGVDTGPVVYSSQASRPTPASSLRPAPGETAVSGRWAVPWPGRLHEPLVLARGVQAGPAAYVLLAVSSQEAQGEAVRTTAVLVALAWPLLVALTGVVTWWRVGRALRSVEALREQVERIGARRLAERVPVPPTHDEVADLAVTMNEMLERLETSQQAQRRFVADASHELRSPIATITASLDVAAAGSATTWQELQPVLTSESHRLGRLVEDLLLLSRADDHAMSLRQRDVDLDDLVDRECRRLRQVSTVEIRLSSRPVRVLGDPLRLDQVLRNVLDNAARHARSRIEVRITLEAAWGAVTVDDDGPGIPAAQRDRVFERFVRLDESRSRHSGGSGLGLAIAREITLAHGGTLTIGDSPTGGARVTLRLPLAP